MKKLLLPSLGIILSFVFFVLSEKSIHAATLYWVGNDGANASVASNWKTTNPTTCGSGDASAIPGSSDTMNFDADCDNGAVIDSSFSSTVSTVVLSSGYAGTVTQSNNLIVSSTFTTTGGTWNVSNKSLAVTSTFTMNTGSTFTASSITTTFSDNFTINGGTFNHNSGTVNFDGISTTLSCNNISFNLVTLTHASGINKTVSSNCSLPLGANPTITGRLTLSGTVSGSGTFNSTSTSLQTFNSGATLSGFSGFSHSGTLTISGATLDFSTYSSFSVASNVTLSSGSLSLPSGADLNAAFTFSGGTFTAPSGSMTLAGRLAISGSAVFNANGGTIIFDGATVATDMTCNSVTFNAVSFNNTGTKPFDSSCSLPIGANPTIPNSIILDGATFTGSGTITFTTGTFTLNAGATLTGFSGISANGFTIAGATLNLSSYSTFTVASTFTISSGSVTLPSNSYLNGNFVFSSGTFTAPTGTLTFRGSITHSGGTFDHNNGTIIWQNVSGNTNIRTITGSNTFYNLSILSNGLNNTKHFTADTTQTILGTFVANDRVTLDSTTDGSQWRIDARGGRALSNLNNVRDSYNVNSQVMVCTNCINLGNNINWSFISGSSIQFSLDYPSGDSHITNTNPTYRWSKATVSNNSAITKYELFIQPKTDTDQNTGTALYIDNISPFIGDNKQYQYNPTYTLYDDGDYLNLTPNNYILNLGKYNYRVVAHDSVGNIQENSYNFWVDSKLSPSIKSTLLQSIKVIQSKPSSNIFPSIPGLENGQPKQVLLPTPTPSPRVFETSTPEIRQDNSNLIIIIFVGLLIGVPSVLLVFKLSRFFIKKLSGR